MKWVKCGMSNCANRVKVPEWMHVQFCEEHQAHGKCCKCGKFWIDASRMHEPMFYDNLFHTPFACR